LICLQGRGPEALTEYIVPVTSAHVNAGAGPQAAGLKPTSPVTAEMFVSLTAAAPRTAKLPAVPRFTGVVFGACGAANTLDKGLIVADRSAAPMKKTAAKRMGLSMVVTSCVKRRMDRPV